MTRSDLVALVDDLIYHAAQYGQVPGTPGVIEARSRLLAAFPGTTETGTRDLEALASAWEREAKRCEDDIKDAPDRDREVHFATMAMPPEAHAKTLRAALPVSRGEASEEEPRDLTCIHGTHEAPICESCFNRRSPSPGSETPRPTLDDIREYAGLPPLGSETPRGAGLGTCPHGYDREPWLCDHCRRAIPSPSLPGDNHAEKEE